MDKLIYLDHNSTTPPDPRVVEAMMPYYNEAWGNASSLHQFGRHAKAGVEEAREIIAKTFNCLPEEIYFTSGGTESDNFAVKGAAYEHQNKGKHIITSKIEHHAILESFAFLEEEGFEATYLPVDQYGFVDPDDLRKAIRPDTILVSVMYANNEVGTIQKMDELASVCQEKGVIFHTDAVQAAGKIPIDLKRTPITLMSTSGHKIYGPKGVGILYIRQGTRMIRWQTGGAHERGMRAGTENVPAIVGYGKAMELAQKEMKDNDRKISAMAEEFRNTVLREIPDVRFNGPEEERIKATVNLCFKGAEGEAVILNLDMMGIGVTSGSACTSGALEPSHVLTAMGVPPELAQSAIRFSFGKDNDPEDIDYIVNSLKTAIEKLRMMSPFYQSQ
ncbi:MAG: aminotransferase class V-fold PLP-dependent enzyme [candidate division Zixibacteria bacterium]|nr:aminotransferase class V-fold PLP-dependent enzyme [candidate division Zixibacteria bacterium]